MLRRLSRCHVPRSSLKPIRYLASHTKFPAPIGLYRPEYEKDSCGVGIIANLDKVQERSVVTRALGILCNVEHRGGAGCDPCSGDGAGAMVGMPDTFLRHVAEKDLGFTLPEKGKYAVGMLFMPRDADVRSNLRALLENEIIGHGFKTLGWRDVPVNDSILGDVPRNSQPFVQQCFIANPNPDASSLDFERGLYLTRKVFERHAENHPAMQDLYVCSLSSKTLVYKGMLTAAQLQQYYLDLSSDMFASDVAMVHSRFSTNTYPSWARAQPFRAICHNGEINTVRGNVNEYRAVQPTLSSPYFPLPHKTAAFRLAPEYDVVHHSASDSQNLDCVVDLLTKGSDRSLAESLLFTVPQAWEHDPSLTRSSVAYLKYNACSMSPWDGPALLAFCDGDVVGAYADRNGLRPGRYWLTTDRHVVFGSEAGVVPDIPSSEIYEKGKIRPGEIFLVDLQEGRVVRDAEVKTTLAAKRPYRQWLDENMLNLKFLSQAFRGNASTYESMFCRSATERDAKLTMFGVTEENMDLIVSEMVTSKKEAMGSMGNDAALACLSHLPHSPFEYFKQRFAQVTNPPLDSVRESSFMSLAAPIGRKSNMLELSPNSCKQVLVSHPVLTVPEYTALTSVSNPNFHSVTVDITFPLSALQTDADLDNILPRTLDQICTAAAEAVVTQDATAIVLSDITAGADRVAVPSLLALGAVKKHLLERNLCSSAALILDVGDAWTVHHMCMLVGYGADAIFPRSAYESIFHLQELKVLEGSFEQSVDGYQQAMDKGMLKVMGKMGVSVVQSYKGAQLFDAVGLNDDVINRCFEGTSSTFQGIGFPQLCRDLMTLHGLAYDKEGKGNFRLNRDSQFHYRADGEKHLNTPANMALLQSASRQNSREAYESYSRKITGQAQHVTLRGSLDFKKAGGVTAKGDTIRSISLDEVEPAAAIVKRFNTGAMSLGSISQEAHETLAIAMNGIGGRSNSGEGGEDSVRFNRAPDGTSKRSSIKQIASGRFGVSSNYLTNADMLQIKMAQGAKPGEGGELPGFKVVGDIARIRHSTPGVGLISPPPHHDIYSIEDLSQLIHDLKNANPNAIVSVKLVSESGVGVIAAGVAKAKADHIVISGGDGGTGASAWTGIKHAGMPWELGVAEAQQALVMCDMRSRVMLQTDGQIKTGRDVAMAFLLGAEECGFATAPLIALGCVMMRKCHLNTCPVGIATQDPELRKMFTGQPEHVVNYFFMVAEECRQIMANLGFRSVDEMIGRCDMLEKKTESTNAKSQFLDFSKMLMPSFTLNPGAAMRCTEKQDHLLQHALDNELIRQAAPALLKGVHLPVSIGPLSINQSNRTIGSMLSHEVSKVCGEEGLPTDTINIFLQGVAGQSLGAFLAKGIRIDLQGECNDYVGKGLSGGTIVVRPPLDAPTEFVAEDNIIVGNVCLYGATRGKAYFRGRAGERFAVRNSGATACVEGVGAHGCEYMTGGRVVILGPIGRNFAAGMSGGIAYILDPNHQLSSLCNMDMVSIGPLAACDTAEIESVRRIVTDHYRRTGSEVAKNVLVSWSRSLNSISRVMPLDYAKVLAEKENAAEAVLQSVPAVVTPAAVTDKFVGPSLRDFLSVRRETPKTRDVEERVRDWGDVYPAIENDGKIEKQASRCMDCGTPFCHMPYKTGGCPIRNLIPEWNKLVKHGDWEDAYLSLSKTNNFPEFTGRVCPAPCEQACVAGLATDAVAIKSIEYGIIDRAFREGWVKPSIPATRTGQRVAVIGSGPAGLSAADELNKLGHSVTVYERDAMPGGLLRYGIPSMKLPKEIVERRINVMKESGVEFVCNADIGKSIHSDDIVRDHDAVLLAVGATVAKELDCMGRDLKGIYMAADFLTKNIARLSTTNPASESSYIDTKGKNVIVIGGGDTGCDVIGTSLRQGCSSVTNFEVVSRPGDARSVSNPWPEWSNIFRVDYGHEEAIGTFGSDPRLYNVMTKEFVGDEQGNVVGVRTVKVEWKSDANAPPGSRPTLYEVPGSETVVPADVVVLAMGFTGPEESLFRALQVDHTTKPHVDVTRDAFAFNTSSPKVFRAGDCRRGQSLVVWAIKEGRESAGAINRHLIGQKQDME